MTKNAYIISPYTLVLNDKPRAKYTGAHEEQFNDLYHLLLAKLARLPIDPAPTKAQEEKLVLLLKEICKAKRGLEK